MPLLNKLEARSVRALMDSVGPLRTLIGEYRWRAVEGGLTINGCVSWLREPDDAPRDILIEVAADGELPRREFYARINGYLLAYKLADTRED